MAVTVVGTTKLEEYRGDTFVRNLTFQDSAGDAVDITGWIIHFTIKLDIDDTDANAIIVKDITTHTDATGGLSRVSMSAAETYVLEGSYFYDIQYVKPDGTVKTIVNDKIKFVKDVTRRTDA